MPNTLPNGRGLLVAALVALAMLLMLAATDSFAGTGGSTEFGRILAITFVAVGLVGGVVRGSIMGFVLGIAAGLGLYTAPTVIDAIVTAVI
jgi:conjugal transfer pilus assembly protein TraA